MCKHNRQELPIHQRAANRSESAVDLRFTVCHLVCLSVTRTNKQSSRFPGDGKTELQTANAAILTPTVRWEQKRAEQRKQPSLLGVKLCLLWTWLTLGGHWQSTAMGETALLADFTLTSSTPAPESQIPWPPHLLILAQAWFNRTEEPLNPAGGRENIKQKHRNPELRYCTYC